MSYELVEMHAFLDVIILPPQTPVTPPPLFFFEIKFYFINMKCYSTSQ